MWIYTDHRHEVDNNMWNYINKKEKIDNRLPDKNCYIYILYKGDYGCEQVRRTEYNSHCKKQIKFSFQEESVIAWCSEKTFLDFIRKTTRD